MLCYILFRSAECESLLHSRNRTPILGGGVRDIKNV